MKNFNLIRNDEEKKIKDIRKTFVTGYDFNKQNNTIDIHFDDGSTCSYEYNEQTKQNVLSKMEQQVIDASNSENVKKYAKDGSEASTLLPVVYFWGGIISGLGCFIGLVLLAEGVQIVTEKNDPFFAYGYLFPTGILSTGLGICPHIMGGKLIAQWIKESNAYRDYKKSKLFLDNKDLINHYVLTDKPILKGMSLRAKKQIKKSNGEININDISKMSLHDLRKLKKNVEARKAQEELFNLRADLLTQEEAHQLVKKA